MKTFLLGIVITAALALGLWFIADGGGAVNTPIVTVTPTVSATRTSSPTPTPKASGYSLVQVAQHDSQSSCWTAVNGSVYDLTPYINQHPGGAGNILSICGKDGSAAFDAQHGGQGRPENILASYRIGALQ